MQQLTQRSLCYWMLLTCVLDSIPEFWVQRTTIGDRNVPVNLNFYARFKMYNSRWILSHFILAVFELLQTFSVTFTIPTEAAKHKLVFYV